MAEGLEVSVRVERDRAQDSILEELSKSLVLVGTNSIRNVQTIGFGAFEAIELGDVSPGGWVYLVNLDSTNFIQVRQGAETAMLRLEPGDPPSTFRLDDSATLEAQADTANCDLLVLAFDP